MNAKPFAIAVVPIVLLDVAVDLAQLSLPDDSDNSWLAWALVAVSFIVFPSWAGARMARLGGSWLPFLLGPDGKRRRAKFEVPHFVTEAELCQYLADLFHESASPAHPEVYRLK